MRRKAHNPDRSKHQHWVPQFYLRYFATAETRDTKTPQVWIFSKREEDGAEALTSVRNVCGKRYLYSPRQLDGARSWAVDDKLNDIEALLGQVWPALATDYVDLSDQYIRKALAMFVSTMHLRHPDMRQTSQEAHEQLASLYETYPKLPDGTPRIDEVEIKGKSYPFDTTDWHLYKNQGDDGHDRNFVEMIQSETGRMAKHLLTKRWSILFSTRDVFITSDKPVILAHRTRDRFGYGTKDTIITLPISPNRLLIMDDLQDKHRNEYYTVLESNIAPINLATWRGSRRFLITGRPVQDVLDEFAAFADAENDA